MESLITSYGINFLHFQRTIKSINSLVAGSSALAAYLEQEGIDPGFKPNDIDIFVSGKDFIGRNITNELDSFLRVYGFTENNKFDTLDIPTERYYSSLKKIQKVTSFTNKDGKEIQVIIVNVHNLIGFIFKDFDLSACISWWNAYNNTFITMDPDTTKRKEMYLMRVAATDELQAKNKVRAGKYIARGFKLIDKPYPFIDSRDPRDLLSDKKFDDIEVTDIFTLDELSIREHLQKSNLNIVIKSGGAYYAFNRKSLMDYMKKKTSNISTIGQVYETPFNQCITLEGYNQLTYADYTIYELTNAYSVPIYNGCVKSLFHLSCYSVKDWIDEKMGKFVEVSNQPGTKVPPQPGTRYHHLPELYAPRTGLEVGINDILAVQPILIIPRNRELFDDTVNNYYTFNTYE